MAWVRSLLIGFLLFGSLLFGSLLFRSLVVTSLVVTSLRDRSLLFRSLLLRSLPVTSLVFRSLVVRFLVFRSPVVRSLRVRSLVISSLLVRSMLFSVLLVSSLVVPALLVLTSSLVTSTAFAREALPEAADPALEARMLAVTSELRCLVCQNQTIADSHADLAVDLRNQVREQLQAGRTNAQIVDYMTARYGDFVLYRPPFKAVTVLLWLGPALMLGGGLLALAVVLRRRAKLSPDAFEPDDDDALAVSHGP